MKRSTDRILVTHVGSLVRPDALVQQLAAKELGHPVDEAAYQATLRASVAEVDTLAGGDASGRVQR